MTRNFYRPLAASPESLQQRLLYNLYGPMPESPEIQRDIYGDTEPERQAILLARLLRYEQRPREITKFGMVD